MVLNDIWKFLILIKWFCCCNCDPCRVTVWERTDLKDVLFPEYLGVQNVTSVKKCAEICALHPECKSFGISSIFLGSMVCFHYAKRVWTNNNATAYLGMVYFWFLEDVCPTMNGFYFFPQQNLCIKNLTFISNWTQHMSECEAEGGILAIVNTHDKSLLLSNFFTEFFMFYVGATDRLTNNFTWLDGSNVMNWAILEPSHNEEHCTALSVFDNRLVDVYCNLPIRSFCQIPIKKIS